MMKHVLILAAFVALAMCADPSVYHVYLSLTGNATELQLTFTTDSEPPSAQIQYWLAATPTQKVTIDAVKEDTVEFKTPFNKVEYITSVTLTALKPDQEYEYSIATVKTSAPERTFQLKTLPDVADPVNIVLYGDLGWNGDLLVTNASGGLTAYARDRKMDFIIHYGDLAYNLATNDGRNGETFMSNIEYAASRMPYLVSPGNHEYMDETKDEALFRGYFMGQKHLGESSKSVDPLMFHSYDLGENIHFIGINTEVYCEATDDVSTMWTWLQNDLEAVAKRAVKPWIVVYGHRQFYDNINFFHLQLMRFGLQCTDESLISCDATPCLSGKNCAYSIEKLFNDYHVDAYIGGHDHKYLRNLPIAPSLTSKSDCAFETQNPKVHYNAQHPVYIVSGAAGLPQTNMEAERVYVGAGSPVVISNGEHSFTFLTPFNLTHLRVQQILVDTDQVLDEVWLVRDPNRPVWTDVVSFTIPSANQTKCDQ